jgi:hypothetical protein
MRKAEAISPNGHLEAVLEYRDSAACCSDHSRIVVSNRPGGTLAEPGVVVTAARANALAPIWVSDDLLIVQMCEAGDLENVKSQVRRNPVAYNADGSTNALRVEVITAPNVKWGDRVLCRKSA